MNLRIMEYGESLEVSPKGKVLYDNNGKVMKVTPGEARLILARCYPKWNWAATEKAINKWLKKMEAKTSK